MSPRSPLPASRVEGGDYYLELWSFSGAPDTAVAYTLTVDAVAAGSLCDPSIFAFCPVQAPVCLGSGQASCGTVDVCAGDDAREPWDDGPRGASLASGPRSVFAGAICSSNQGAERDWYRIPVAQGEDLRATVTWTTPWVDLDFAIRGADGQVIQSGVSGAGHIEELWLTGLVGGDYYLELWSFAGARDTAVAYTVTLDTFTLDTPCGGSFAFCPAYAPACVGTGDAARCTIVDACSDDDGREHLDDGPLGATAVSGQTEIAGRICGARDNVSALEEDWYEVVLAPGEPLRITLAWPDPGVDLDLHMGDRTGVPVAHSELSYPEELVLDTLAPGRYYVIVASWDGAPTTAVDYTLTFDRRTCYEDFQYCLAAAPACVGNHAAARCGIVDACAWDDAREPGDDGPAGATLVSAPGQTFDGYLCGGSDGPAAWESDWFRVGVDEGHVLYAAWVGDFAQTGDLDLTVRDAAGVLWARTDAFANPEGIAIPNLPAGDYYLELRAHDDEGEPAYYQLDVTTCLAADGCASPSCSVDGEPVCHLCAEGFDPDGLGGCEEHDACVPEPCQNAGTCVGTGPNQYWCLCQDGYVGGDCETFIGQCQTDFDCSIDHPVCWVDAGVGSCLASEGCLDDDPPEELDDGPWGASFVAAGEDVVGRVCDTVGEYDWYWVTVEDEPLRVTLDWPSAGADLDLYVFDASGQAVTSSAEFVRPESITLVLAAHGDYWLRVSAFSGAPTSAIEYTLQVTQECWGPIECPSWAPACVDGQCVVVDGCVDDDRWEHADDGPNGASWFALGTELDKRICGAHDAATVSEADWVAITLEPGQSLAVELAWDDASVDLDLYLIDPSGQVSLSSAGSDRPERITSADHPAGSYYAVVTGWSGAPVHAIDYRLSLGDTDDCSPDPCGGSGCTDTGVNSFQCGMQFHGGPVMTAPINVYYVWYGDWQGNTATKILEDLARGIGGSARWATNSTYTDAFGTPVSDTVTFAGRAFDGYSRGTELTYADIWGIVADAIGLGALPLDPDGIYVVLSAADVTVTDLCASYCGWHSYAGFNDVDVKYALVANAELACPESCGVRVPSPNGNPGADAMASILVHELEEAATDPLLNAWYDGIGLENSDKCVWSFGDPYSVGGGALANVRLGARDFLIQQNWVNALGGYCALRYPPLEPVGALVPLSLRRTFLAPAPGEAGQVNPRFPVAVPRGASGDD